MSDELMCERLRHMGLATCDEAAERIEALTEKCVLLAASLDRADADIAALKDDIEEQIRLTREAMEVTGEYREVLRQIAYQEHIELMLDPTWAQRVAKAAIAKEKQNA